MFGVDSNISDVIGNLTTMDKDIRKAENNINRRLAVETLSLMKREPPVGIPVLTGTLKRGHGIRAAAEVWEIFCSVYYWIYVVFGTKRGQATYLGVEIRAATVTGPNDYRLRALTDLRSSGAYSKIVREEMDKALKRR